MQSTATYLVAVSPGAPVREITADLCLVGGRQYQLDLTREQVARIEDLYPGQTVIRKQPSAPIEPIPVLPKVYDNVDVTRLDGLTKAELLELADKLGVDADASMRKAEIFKAVDEFINDVTGVSLG